MLNTIKTFAYGLIIGAVIIISANSLGNVVTISLQPTAAHAMSMEIEE